MVWRLAPTISAICLTLWVPRTMEMAGDFDLVIGKSPGSSGPATSRSSSRHPRLGPVNE